MTVSRLCDAYGALLTEHRREVIRDFYDYDLSLAEIAENRGVTRQAALCSIRQAESQLRDYESKLGLVAGRDELAVKLSAVISAMDSDVSAAKAMLEKIAGEI